MVYRSGTIAWMGRLRRSRFGFGGVSATARFDGTFFRRPAKLTTGQRRISWRLAGAAGAVLCVPLFLHPIASAAETHEANVTIKIAFAGDSLVDNYWAGITRLVAANPCPKITFELGRFARNSTGLARGDRVYWPREIRRINDKFKPTLTVISIGLNDRQFIVDGKGARTAWGAPEWSDKYRHEIMEFFEGAIASDAIVLVMGLPVMRDRVANADATEKDSMFMEAINAIGAPNLHYVEPWKLSGSEPDTFSSYGRAKNGRILQIRSPDGEHFATDGEDLLAQYLLPVIIGSLKEAGFSVDQCPNMPQTKAEN
jgi:hypothetical protein